MRHPASDPQTELVQQYCGEAEDIIAGAETPEQAEEAGRALCLMMRENCTSGLLVDATEKYITNLIRAKFGEANNSDNQH